MPVPFHEFTFDICCPLFSWVVLPTQTKNILPALGEPAVKRERTTNSAKS